MRLDAHYGPVLPELCKDGRLWKRGAPDDFSMITGLRDKKTVRRIRANLSPLFFLAVLAEISYSTASKPDRTMSPGSGMSDDDRRKLIAHQRSALYGGESPFGEAPSGYPDEPRHAAVGTAAGLRGHSPLAYEYGRGLPDSGPQPPANEPSQPLPNDLSRANSNSSPQSNPPAGSKPPGLYDAAAAAGPQQAIRTSASSPGGSPPRQGLPAGAGGQGSVAPIGTRPSAAAAATGPASKRSSPPLSSPLGQGYTSGSSNSKSEEGGASAAAAPPPSSSSASAAAVAAAAAAAEGTGGVGLTGWGARPGGWGSKPGLGVQASVWG